MKWKKIFFLFNLKPLVQVIHFLNTFTSTQQYFVASWTCHSPRRNKILLLADDFVGEVPLTSDHAKGHYWCYFHHECLQRNLNHFVVFWSCLLCFLSDVKAETLPLAQKWPVVKGLHSHKWSEVKVLNLITQLFMLCGIIHVLKLDYTTLYIMWYYSYF